MPIYEIFVDGNRRKVELSRTGESSFTAKIDGKTLSIEVLKGPKLDFENNFSIKIDNKSFKIKMPKGKQEKPFPVKVEEATFKAEVKIPARRQGLAIFEPPHLKPIRSTRAPKQIVEGAVTAPMTGKILSVNTKKGEQVKAGQVLCILEAMKMENEITTPKAGTVQEVYVSEGSSVSEGEPLFLVN